MHETLRGLGLGRLAAGLGVVAGTRQGLGVLDDVLGRLHPHVPVGVEPGPSGPPGELVELADREAPDAVAVELRERRHQHRADRDVDADPERVGAADDRQQALAGQALDEAAVAGEHPGVVDADAVAQETIEGGAEAASHPHAPQRLDDRLALGVGW